MKEALLKILEEHPKLDNGGYGVTNNEDREYLLKKADPEYIDFQIGNTIEWINNNLKKIKSINYNSSSYGLKHIAEREIGYISNGEFILAMIYCGFKFTANRYNPNFNISNKSLNNVRTRVYYGGKKW